GDRPRIFNQVTAVHNVKELASLVAKATKSKIDYLPNPRREDTKNDLVVDNSQFLKLGLNPTTLSQGLMDEVSNIATKYIDRADKSKIPATSKWRERM
ncbi:MAG TPA: hypothetical protein VGS28_00305, partial [Candidatus Saccharimonadales bacterium]|nr:hypothetical protein [Candidatus Saccharimonadales bacterium]